VSFGGMNLNKQQITLRKIKPIGGTIWSCYIKHSVSLNSPL